MLDVPQNVAYQAVRISIKLLGFHHEGDILKQMLINATDKTWTLVS
jgi:hypothetical protein